MPVSEDLALVTRAGALGFGKRNEGAPAGANALVGRRAHGHADNVYGGGGAPLATAAAKGSLALAAHTHVGASSLRIKGCPAPSAFVVCLEPLQ